MRNIKVFRGVYTFEDTYRSHFRLSICAHGEYDTEHFTGYLVIPKENQTIGRITPAQLYDQLSKEGVMISKFRYIRLIACDSATCEKDSPDSPYNFEDSFASEFSKLCPNNIVIGYLGVVKIRHNYFNPNTLSYEHGEGIQRNEEVFRINDTYQLHFSALSQNQTATAAFRAEKEAYSKVETNDPVTPIPFLRPKERRKPINNFDADMEKYTSIWFKNGKRIVSEILML